MLREIEKIQESNPGVKTELQAFAENNLGSENDAFVFEVKKYKHNQASTTSMPLLGKTADTLEKKSTNRLLAQRRVKAHFSIHKIK